MVYQKFNHFLLESTPSQKNTLFEQFSPYINGICENEKIKVSFLTWFLNNNKLTEYYFQKNHSSSICEKFLKKKQTISNVFRLTGLDLLRQVYENQHNSTSIFQIGGGDSCIVGEDPVPNVNFMTKFLFNIIHFIQQHPLFTVAIAIVLLLLGLKQIRGSLFLKITSKTINQKVSEKVVENVVEKATDLIAPLKEAPLKEIVPAAQTDNFNKFVNNNWDTFSNGEKRLVRYLKNINFDIHFVSKINRPSNFINHEQLKEFREVFKDLSYTDLRGLGFTRIAITEIRQLAHNLSQPTYLTSNLIKQLNAVLEKNLS